MAPEVAVYTTPPEGLVELLRRSHPLLALPLVRRLQFAARIPGGITEHARILWCSGAPLQDHRLLAVYKKHDDDDDGKVGVELRKGEEEGEEETEGSSSSTGRKHVPFAAAYLDFSRGPETELWIYSSMEGRLDGTWGSEKGTGVGREEGGREGASNGDDNGDDWGREEEIACAVALLREVKRLQDLYFVPGSPQAREREFPSILVGNLHEVLRERLVAPEVGMAIVSTGLYDKWVFEVGQLPDVGLPDVLGDDGRRWVWDVVRREDIAFTISRTQIPRRERTMKLLPSTALYLDDGTPIAWAFLGPDSSLSSLHCEEPYRGRGIAKALAAKVLREHLTDYSDDACYGWADVAPDNIQSQGVCRSLKGQARWQISWSRLNLDQSFPDE
ncbi:hypothetical protein F4824DRAFT_120496 [Ustulina deusta]|nr:hypothetical protein F4824DRAFT_120496 [Ustulina deusta]